MMKSVGKPTLCIKRVKGLISAQSRSLITARVFIRFEYGRKACEHRKPQGHNQSVARLELFAHSKEFEAIFAGKTIRIAILGLQLGFEFVEIDGLKCYRSFS